MHCGPNIEFQDPPIHPILLVLYWLDYSRIRQACLRRDVADKKIFVRYMLEVVGTLPTGSYRKRRCYLQRPSTLPISDGMLPDSLFDPKERTLRFVKKPISVGIVDVRRLL